MANPTVTLNTSKGAIAVELFADRAPKSVDNFLQYARDGHYAGTVFHRVIPGFMAQSGDPTGTGRGGSEKPNLKAEFSKLPFERGTCGAARTADPNSANSQWFICFQSAPHLKGQYTVWGQVASGMEHVDALPTGEPPAKPEKIQAMRVAADVEG